MIERKIIQSQVRYKYAVDFSLTHDLLLDIRELLSEILKAQTSQKKEQSSGDKK